MDDPNYNNQNYGNQNFIDKPDKDYPTENEVISSQNIYAQNTPEANYCPPPVPIESYQPTQTGNVQPNPQPQPHYMNYPPQNNSNNINPTVPPSIPVGNGVNYQPVNYNQNAVVVPVQNPVQVPVQVPGQVPVQVPVQPQPQIIYHQPIIQVQPAYDPIKAENERRIRQQQQDEEDCATCCAALATCLLCCCLLAGNS